MNKLRALLTKIESGITDHELTNSAISKSSVGWHIEHSLLTITRIIEGLKRSDPKKYKRSYTMARFLVFTFNRIPRGRAKSPSIVAPQQYDAESLKNHITKVRTAISEIDQLVANNYIEHPYFGHLNVKATKKFLLIHTNHHLKIMDDIRSK